MSQFTCKKCGDEFTPSAETKELFFEGFIAKPDTCDFCAKFGCGDDCNDYEEYSDADPGL